jgi:hypothetical protein
MYSRTGDGFPSCQAGVFLEPESRVRGGGPKPKTAAEKLAQFWSQVKRAGMDACWDWQGCAYHNGYGQVYLGKRSGKQINDSAHNVMWRLLHGDIPKGLVIRHRCDRPICVNPRHLLIGTQADNIEDARIQGKYNKPKPSLQRIKGADRERVIREVTTGPRGTTDRLAEEFGVTRQCIRKIVREAGLHFDGRRRSRKVA